MVLGLIAAGYAMWDMVSYNRKNYFFDNTIAQERAFQEQDMRIEQFALYREDVRDLVELTVGKMDLYLIAAALLVDRTIVMICKQNEAFPSWSPEWAVTLNAMSLASGVFYLLLALWLAMYASISAQCFGARLLTQFVRLPYARIEEMVKATKIASDFDSQGARELLRVPVLGVGGNVAHTTALPRISEANRGSSAAAAAAAAATSSSAGASSSSYPQHHQQGGGGGVTRATSAESSAAGEAPNGHTETAGPPGGATQGGENSPWNLLPIEMLEHIILYREVQLNWQAYDAYARVCLFIGASSLLYSCLYWALGQFLQLAGAPCPALGVGIIFAGCQMLLSKLDLRLSRCDMLWICSVLALTPILTTTGLLLHQMHHTGEKPKKPTENMHHLMMLLATLAHALHAVVSLMTLWAAWPDADKDGGALLPNRFQSSLYLDVFGWLLNFNGEAFEGGPRLTRAFRRVRSWLRGRRSPPPDVNMQAPLLTEQHFQDNPRGAFLPGCEPSAMPPSSMRTETTHAPTGSAMGSIPASATSLQQSGQNASTGGSASFQERGRRPPSFASPASHPVLGTFPTTASPRIVRENSAELDPVLAQNLRRSFNPSLPQTQSDVRARPPATSSASSSYGPASSVGFGGHEAIPIDRMVQAAAPRVDLAATFTEMPAAQVNERASLPGQTPWTAFKHGTIIITFLWVCTTIQVFWVFHVKEKYHHGDDPDDPDFLDLYDEPLGLASHRRGGFAPEPSRALAQGGCAALTHTEDEMYDGGSPASSWAAARNRTTFGAAWEPWHEALPIQLDATFGVERWTTEDEHCDLHNHFRDVAIDCRSPQDCAAILLSPSGTRLNLCSLQRPQQSSSSSEKKNLRASFAATLLVSPGLGPLKSIAFGHEEEGSAGGRKVFARLESGGLLALRIQKSSEPGTYGLAPELELEGAAAREDDQAFRQEALIALGSTLLSLQVEGFAEACPFDQEDPSKSRSTPELSDLSGLKVRFFDFSKGISHGWHPTEEALPLVLEKTHLPASRWAEATLKYLCLVDWYRSLAGASQGRRGSPGQSSFLR